MTAPAETQTVIRGLRASDPEALPFGRNLQIRSFVLERRAGDLLLYSTPTTAARNVWRQYLGHRHEASFAAPAVNAPLFVHADERAAVEERVPVRAAFSRRHMLDDDFEVIPTPGHTSGATAYLWDNGEHRVLFSADTIMLRDGEWRAAVLDSSDRGAYLESLALLRELDFDVLVPWAVSGAYHARTDPADARRRIDAMIARVRRGESG